MILFESLAFMFADGFIFVSANMKEFYEKRYPACIAKISTVIPCVSDLVAVRDVRRIPSSFCYIGGMSAWQNFDQIVEIMNDVKKYNSEVTFSVATKEATLCSKILAERASEALLQCTHICSLTGRDEIQSFLSSHEFGLLIRSDVEVNHVSSPIKLAEYLSCGVNVITTRAIKSYRQHVEKAGYLIDLELFSGNRTLPRFLYRGEKIALDVHRDFFSKDAACADVAIFLGRI